MLDRAGDGRRCARDKLTELGLMTIQNINQPVETLSGGQRQGVAVARAAAFGSSASSSWTSRRRRSASRNRAACSS